MRSEVKGVAMKFLIIDLNTKISYIVQASTKNEAIEKFRKEYGVSYVFISRLKE